MIKQGVVYWYSFRAPDKRRPVLILTHTSAVSYLNSVTVARIGELITQLSPERMREVRAAIQFALGFHALV